LSCLVTGNPQIREADGFAFDELRLDSSRSVAVAQLPRQVERHEPLVFAQAATVGDETARVAPRMETRQDVDAALAATPGGSRRERRT